MRVGMFYRLCNTRPLPARLPVRCGGAAFAVTGTYRRGPDRGEAGSGTRTGHGKQRTKALVIACICQNATHCHVVQRTCARESERAPATARTGREQRNGRPVTLEEAYGSLRMPNGRTPRSDPMRRLEARARKALSMEREWARCAPDTPMFLSIHPSIPKTSGHAGAVPCTHPRCSQRPPHIGSLRQQQHPADVQRAWARRRAGLGRLRSEAACGSERYVCGMECGLQRRTPDRMTAVIGSKQRTATKRNGERHKLHGKKT
jgi:hypothetical protein